MTRKGTHKLLRLASISRSRKITFGASIYAKSLYLLALAAVLLVTGAPGAADPRERLTWGVHVSLAPTWFDPAETQAIAVPYMVMYALHDAMVKAMPGQPLAPSLAESWAGSNDGLTYEFVLREGTKFH